MTDKNEINTKMINITIIMCGFVLLFFIISILTIDRVQSLNENIKESQAKITELEQDNNRLFAERFFLWLGLNKNVTFQMPSCFPGFQQYDWRDSYIAWDRARLQLNSSVISDVVLTADGKVVCYDNSTAVIDCAQDC